MSKPKGPKKGSKSKTLAQGRKPGTGMHGNHVIPTKLCPEVLDDLASSIASTSTPFRDELRGALDAGLPVEIACAAAGISTATYHNWRKRAQDESDPHHEMYAEFFRLTEQLRAKQARRHMENIQAIALGERKGNWLGSAWSLERTYQDYFALKPSTQAVQVNIDAKDVVSQADAAALSYRARQDALQRTATEDAAVVEAEIVDEAEEV